MTSGGEETTAWWGKMKDDRDKMSSTFVLSLVAFLFALSFLIVMIMVICKKCKRRRAAKLAASSLSLPPPYEVIVLLWTVESLFFLLCNVNDPLLFEMVVEEKERLATETGLPSYKEACRSNLSWNRNKMILRNLPWNHDPAWTSSVYRLNLTSFTGRHSHNRPSLVPSVSSIYICVYCTLKVSNPGEPSMILRIGGCESNSIDHILPNHFMHYRKTIEVQSVNYWNL